MKKALLCAASALFLSACATGPMGMQGASHEFTSANQDSRAQFLILHYTATDWPVGQRGLTNAGSGVSAHYLVRDEPPIIYQLVDENRRAWQAGASYWAGNQNLNSASIGIEIVNLGFTEAPGTPNAADTANVPKVRTYYPFPQAQIDEVIRLTKDIVARNHIKPEHVLGHQDIAPGRKSDPGPLFPWKQFYAAGIIPWPDAAQVAVKQAQYEQAGVPDVVWVQDKLGRFGYDMPHTGMLDEKTKSVILTFQLKYRPSNFDGVLDAETAALIDVATTPGGMLMAPQPPQQPVPK